MILAARTQSAATECTGRQRDLPAPPLHRICTGGPIRLLSFRTRCSCHNHQRMHKSPHLQPIPPVAFRFSTNHPRASRRKPHLRVASNRKPASNQSERSSTAEQCYHISAEKTIGINTYFGLQAVPPPPRGPPPGPLPCGWEPHMPIRRSDMISFKATGVIFPALPSHQASPWTYCSNLPDRLSSQGTRWLCVAAPRQLVLK